jgi:hypothetical protein
VPKGGLRAFICTSMLLLPAFALISTFAQPFASGIKSVPFRSTFVLPPPTSSPIAVTDWVIVVDWVIPDLFELVSLALGTRLRAPAPSERTVCSGVSIGPCWPLSHCQ